MLWAEEQTPAEDVAGALGWLNYGVLGLLVIAAIAGYIVFRPHVRSLEAERDRALARADKAEAQRDALADSWKTEVLPMLHRFLSTSEALLRLAERNPGGEQK